jgi:hypothetical protein
LSPLRLPISPPGQDCEERNYDTIFSDFCAARQGFYGRTLLNTINKTTAAIKKNFRMNPVLSLPSCSAAWSFEFPVGLLGEGGGW